MILALYKQCQCLCHLTLALCVTMVQHVIPNLVSESDLQLWDCSAEISSNNGRVLNTKIMSSSSILIQIDTFNRGQASHLVEGYLRFLELKDKYNYSLRNGQLQELASGVISSVLCSDKHLTFVSGYPKPMAIHLSDKLFRFLVAVGCGSSRCWNRYHNSISRNKNLIITV